MTKTRKSTPKYEVYHIASGTVVLSGISKTEANEIARDMGGCAVRFVEKSGA
jgi:hypothetical protein